MIAWNQKKCTMRVYMKEHKGLSVNWIRATNKKNSYRGPQCNFWRKWIFWKIQSYLWQSLISKHEVADNSYSAINCRAYCKTESTIRHNNEKNHYWTTRVTPITMQFKLTYSYLHTICRVPCWILCDRTLTDRYLEILSAQHSKNHKYQLQMEYHPTSLLSLPYGTLLCQ